MRRLFSVAVLLLIGSSAFAASLTEQQKIAALLDAFNEPGLVFIRNGEEHDGAYARKHLEEKLKKTKGVDSAEDFITKVASNSSHSGKPYMVKLKDGTQMESGTWLRHKLAEIEKQAHSPDNRKDR